MMKKIFFCVIQCFLVACIKTENGSDAVVKKFMTRCMEIKLPHSYEIDSTYHWDMGNIYHVKNAKDEEIMFFYSGWHTLSSRNFDWNSLTNEFKVNNKLDTIEEWNGKKIKRKIVVLQAKLCSTNRKPSDTNYPLVVEFSCFPDFADSLTCENIISSAKIRHEVVKGDGTK